MTFQTYLILLLWGHFLADYPLQGDFLAQAKNPNTPIGKTFWRWALPAHAFIHAGIVFIVTGSLLLAGAEFVVHSATDYAKCTGKIGLNTDQAIHVACKVIWAALAVRGLA